MTHDSMRERLHLLVDQQAAVLDREPTAANAGGLCRLLDRLHRATEVATESAHPSPLWLLRFRDRLRTSEPVTVPRRALVLMWLMAMEVTT